jgi:uncharacterized protein (TIGR03083 family)
MTTTSDLTISTAAADAAQARFVRDALRSQRLRLVELFRGFDTDAWGAATLCTQWTAHQVVRHLCDATLKATDILRGDAVTDVADVGFDPRTTPVAWLERSAGETPADSVRCFEEASAVLLTEVDALVDRGSVDDQRPFLYGPVPWSIVALHVFWDAWIHERDIVVPAGPHPDSPAIESRAAATYGLSVSCVPAAPITETVVLEGDGGGVFRMEANDGTVTTSVSDGPAAEDALRGSLPEVVDSLIGRGPELTAVLDGPPERVERLGMLRAFMLMPVG